MTDDNEQTQSELQERLKQLYSKKTDLEFLSASDDSMAQLGEPLGQSLIAHELLRYIQSRRNLVPQRMNLVRPTSDWLSMPEEERLAVWWSLTEEEHTDLFWSLKSDDRIALLRILSPKEKERLLEAIAYKGGPL